MKYIIDILPIILLIITLIGVRPVKPISNINENYLTKETGQSFRGIFAIVIVFHHLSQIVQSGLLFNYFNYLGYLSVAVFFFFSGYGLQKSYIIKKQNYRKKFLLKRLPAVVFPYAIVTIIYWILFLCNGDFYSFYDVIYAIISGNPIVSNSWYVIAIIVFYLVFYLLMIICKERYLLMIILSNIWYILYVVLCIQTQYGEWWYKSTFALIIGMIWATYENRIIQFVRKHFSVVPILWILFIVSFILKDLEGKSTILSPIPGFDLILYILSSSFFTISIILTSMKLHIGNKILSFFFRKNII